MLMFMVMMTIMLLLVMTTIALGYHEHAEVQGNRTWPSPWAVMMSASRMICAFNARTLRLT
jgi:hypothetical protein